MMSSLRFLVRRLAPAFVFWFCRRRRGRSVRVLVLRRVDGPVEGLLQPDDRDRDVGDKAVVHKQETCQSRDLFGRELVRHVAPSDASRLVESLDVLAGDLADPSRGLVVLGAERYRRERILERNLEVVGPDAENAIVAGRTMMERSITDVA